MTAGSAPGLRAAKKAASSVEPEVTASTSLTQRNRTRASGEARLAMTDRRRAGPRWIAQTAKVPQSTAASRGTANAVTIRQLRRAGANPQSQDEERRVRRKTDRQIQRMRSQLHVVVRRRDDVDLGRRA